MDSEENHIIKGIRSGDEAAFKMLFDTYYPNLLVFSNKFLDDMEASRDIVQELFMNLFESSESLEIHTSLKSYLYGSVRNRCLNYIKYIEVRKKHMEDALREEIENNVPLEEKMDAIELEARIFEIVSALPEKCRRIYIMSRGEGIPNKEIAEKLELSIRTVETQISNALKVLRDTLLPLKRPENFDKP